MELALAGNLNIKSVLKNAFSTGHIPHAIIIEGEAGLGKKTLAKFIAKACVCQGDDIPCFNCKGCQMADMSTHPDIMTVAPEPKRKNIDIEQIRSLRSEAYLMPQTAKHKVFIIEKADTMNANSANALLKILEEPPGGAVFILITEYSASLLPTVRSRCITLSLVPPTFDEAFSVLKKLNTATDDDIKQALSVSGCNIGRALNILQSADSSLIQSAAENFYKAFALNDSYAMLLALHPLEKDRVGAAEAFTKIRIKIAEQIKDYALRYKDTEKLYKAYGILAEAIESLTYNISLPLVFAQVCASISAD